MSLINATYSTLSIKIGDAYFPITCEQSHSWTEQANMLETTTRENEEGWKTSVPTIQGYSLSFSGIYDVNVDAEIRAGYIFLAEAKRSREIIYWKTDDGFHQEYGHGLITSLSMSANIDEYVGFSGSIRGNSFPSDTDNTVVETQPVLLVDENPYWQVDKIRAFLHPVSDTFVVYMAAVPDAFIVTSVPELTDFVITINDVPESPVLIAFGNVDELFLEVGTALTNTDVIKVSYTVGTIPLINQNGYTMLSLPETTIKNDV